MYLSAVVATMRSVRADGESYTTSTPKPGVSSKRLEESLFGATHVLVLRDDVGESRRLDLGVVATLLEGHAVDLASLGERRDVRGIHLDVSQRQKLSRSAEVGTALSEGHEAKDL